MFEGVTKADRLVVEDDKQKPERRRLKDLGKVLTVFGSLYATDIAPGTIEEIDGRSWTSGVELLKDDINNNTHEVAAFFFMNGKGGEEWNTFGVPDGASRVSLDMGQYKHLAAKYEDLNGNIERACFAHTHPIGAFSQDIPAAKRHLAPLIAQERVLFAPSVPDVNMMPITEIINNSSISVVFEVSGAWYTRMANEADWAGNLAIAKHVEEERALNDSFFGTDETEGELYHALTRLSDDDIATLLGEVGGEIQKWSDWDERSERELRITAIINELLQKEASNINLGPYLDSLEPQVTELYSQIYKVKERRQYIYEFLQLYAAVGNVSSDLLLKEAAEIQEVLEPARPDYIEQYKNVFGHEPQLDGSLKDLLIEGLL